MRFLLSLLLAGLLAGALEWTSDPVPSTDGEASAMDGEEPPPSPRP